jgi:hypothetical protein
MAAPMPRSTDFVVSLKTVELALFDLHKVKPEHFDAWRARFSALQRAGLLGEAPGKGRRLSYTVDHFRRLILAFELIQARIAPSLIVPLIKNYWDSKLKPIFDKAERGGPDMLLSLAGLVAMIESEDSIPSINGIRADKFADLWMALDGKSIPPRALVINISFQLRKFRDALVSHHPQPEDLALDRPQARRKRSTKTRSR